MDKDVNILETSSAEESFFAIAVYVAKVMRGAMVRGTYAKSHTSRQ